MIKNRHQGRFSIGLELIDLYPSAVLDFTQGMLVLEARYNFPTNSIDYLGVDALKFSPVNSGEDAPWYDVVHYYGPGSALHLERRALEP